MPVPVTGGSGSPWQQDLLLAMGAAQIPTNINALGWWADSEGLPSDLHNWLGTTMAGYGGSDYNAAHVKRYPTRAAGVAATLATLQLAPYVVILRAFQSGQTLRHLWQAINGSPWCPRCQAGSYPQALYQQLGGASDGSTTVATPTATTILAAGGSAVIAASSPQSQGIAPPPRNVGPESWDWSPTVTSAGLTASGIWQGVRAAQDALDRLRG
jgi:hypothetical protein